MGRNTRKREGGSVRLGLKIDVCTYDGLRFGVPNLLRLFDRRRIQASFFVALGPDTSGRAVFRMFRPGFLAKMRRTQAIATYGLRTALSGTLLPSRRPYPDLARILGDIVSAGHELAAHGFNHRRWQDRLERLDDAQIRAEVAAAVEVCRCVSGRSPKGFGAPGWQCTPGSLRAVEAAGFSYASDTRGQRPFFPRIGEETLRTLQLPTTFPTLDEVLGFQGMREEDFLRAIRSGIGNPAGGVVTLHAEMEGRGHLSVAGDLLEALAAEGSACIPLAQMAESILTPEGRAEIPAAEIVHRSIRGRAGTVAMPKGWEVT
jgi:peptidoglycan/xylan/chitin deacetylase (PgdA/CDA1 family)